MLDKPTLKTGIENLLESLFNDTSKTPAQARTAFATGLSNLIDAFVKTGLVTVDTTGSSTAQHGTGNIT